MSRQRARLDKLERAALAKTPRRLIVLWPGDTKPEDLGPNDILIVVTYTDGAAAEADLPTGAGATIVLPDNGRGDMPRGIRTL